MTVLAVVTTVGSLDQARAMARALVERGLAACAQIEPIESFYTWDGRLEHEQEFRILLKTTTERYDAVEAAIRQLHDYDLPAIYAVTVERAYGPYAQWVERSARTTPDQRISASTATPTNTAKPSQ